MKQAKLNPAFRYVADDTKEFAKIAYQFCAANQKSETILVTQIGLALRWWAGLGCPVISRIRHAKISRTLQVHRGHNLFPQSLSDEDL